MKGLGAVYPYSGSSNCFSNYICKSNQVNVQYTTVTRLYILRLDNV